MPTTLNLPWLAGVAASPLGASVGAQLDRAGRVRVQSDLSVIARPEVFVVGDLAAAFEEDGEPVPGVSPAAIQAGNHAAKNIQRQIQGQPPEPWAYFDKGSMATIGRYKAVANIAGLKFGGLMAWLAWLFVHILFLITFRNRVFVFWHWTWAHANYAKGARLITGSTERGVLKDV